MAPSRSTPRGRSIAAMYGIALAVGLWVGRLVPRDSLVQHGCGASAAALVGLPALAGGVAGFWALVGPHGARELSQALLRTALCFHLGLQVGIAVHQAKVDYSTTYDYGQRGLAATATFLRNHTSAEERISCMKDVGLLAGRRYFENYGPVYDREAARQLIDRGESGAVRFIVFTEGIGQNQLAVQPVLGDWVSSHARLVASFGNYRIYEPRTRRRPPGPA